MNLLFVFLQAGGGGDYSFLIMMVAIFAIMYFFMIRPQNKKQKEIANFRKNLEVCIGMMIRKSWIPLC